MKDNLRELCIQIESAMSDHVPPDPASGQHSRAPSQPSRGGSHLSAQEIAELSGGQSTGPGMSNWMGLLKNRIENLTSAYSNVSTTLAVKEKEVAQKEKAEMIAKQELDREKNKTRFILPSDSSAGTADMSHIDRIAADLNAREKTQKQKETRQRLQSSSVFTNDKGQSNASHPKTAPPKTKTQSKTSKSTISALPNFRISNLDYRRESLGQSISKLGGRDSSLTRTGNRTSMSRTQRRPGGQQKEISKYKDIAIDPDEALKVKNQIRQDAIRLKRMNRSLEHMRKVSATDRPKDGFTKMEAQYWKARCDILKKSKSLGYYYFLSEHQRERCEPCHRNPNREIPMKESKPTVPPSKYCKNLSFLAYEAPSRVVPELRKVTFKGELVDPHQLMLEKYFTREEEHRAVFPQEFNDESCPGAMTMADGRRRCMACASANKDLPNFYDGLVAPHGDHHFYIPPLVTTHVPMDKRHEEMRKIVTGPAIGQHHEEMRIVTGPAIGQHHEEMRIVTGPAIGQHLRSKAVVSG